MKQEQLNREDFCRELIGELSQVLEDTVGLEEAEAFVRLVGLKMGDNIFRLYHDEDSNWTRERLSRVLVDLKARIKGGFRVESINGEKITLINHCCPFAERVIGRESLCQMTTSVFGRIVSQAFGEGQVYVEKSIARGDGHCRVHIFFSPDPYQEGTSFFKEEI